MSAEGEYSSAELFLRAKAVVHAVLEVADGDLETRITELCEGDALLEEHVRTLLTPPPSSFLRPPTPATSWTAEGAAAAEDAVLDGKYALRERIGAGAMGVVYRAEHLQLQKVVAIKVLKASPNPSAEELERVVSEARVVSGIRHENVVAVHDVGVWNGCPYMVMDWVKGVDLSRWLAHAQELRGFDHPLARLPLRAFCESELQQACTGPLWSRTYAEIVAFVVMKVARAAHEAHARGFIHRDIAPKNILLRADGTPMLVDFGVATLSSEGETETSRASVAGTLPYMPPEQFGVGTASRRPTVDVYGLGATLYHLLCGRMPFTGDANQVLARVTTELPPDLASLRDDIPTDLVAICFAAMEKRPEARYASALELAEDLEAFLERRPVSRRPPGALGRLRRWCQRRPQAAIAAAALIALTFASLGGGVLVQRELDRRRTLENAEVFAATFARLPVTATLDANAGYASAPIRVAADAGLGELLGKLIHLEPDEPLLRWYRANWASQWGELQECERELEALRALGYGSPLFEELARALLDEDPVVRNQLVRPDQLPPPSSAFDHAALGYVAHRWRQSDRAWDELSRAVELEPERWMYRDLRILPGLDRGDIELAVGDAVYVKGILGVETSRTLHALALAAYDRSEVGEARDLWSRALDLCPDQYPPLNNIGYIHYDWGEYDQAKERLQRAAQVKPGGSKAYVVLSRCAARQGDFSAALQTLAEGLADLPDGAPDAGFRPRMELELERACVLLEWAAEQARSGESTDAREIYQEVDELFERLEEEVARDTMGLAEELASMRIILDAELGRKDDVTTVRDLREVYNAYLAKTGSGSAVIATNLGMALLVLGDEHRAEAETYLMIGMTDDRTWFAARRAHVEHFPDSSEEL